MKIRIINKSMNDLPSYATESSAGMDLRAAIESSITLGPLERKLVGTGLFMELPQGYEAQIRPRSGLAFKHGISIVNAPGTIDADYRGEIGILLVNLSSVPFVIEPGERIAQMVIAKHEHVEWEMSEELSNTERGAGGYGHTGVK
jgi:dUTP pyrophosphatase